MNSDPEDVLIERELRALRPAAVSKSIENRISGLITDPSPPLHRPGWWHRLGFSRPVAAFGWGLAAPVAAVAVTLLMAQPNGQGTSPSPSTKRATDTAEPDARVAGISPLKETGTAKTANVLDGEFDEGVVPDGDDGLAHRVRYQSTDFVQWRNPRTGAQWEVSYPREDVLLFPVNAE